MKPSYRALGEVTRDISVLGLNQGVGDGVSVCVAEAYVDGAEGFLAGELGSTVMEFDAWGTGIVSLDLEVYPIKSGADA